MRVLITGASGFAGRHLAAHCGDLASVTGLGRLPLDGDLPDGLEDYLLVELLDAEATRAAVAGVAPERVFHLAADASVAASWNAPTRTIENNVVATTNLLDAVLAECPEARVLVAGSGEQYGRVPPERLPADEDEPQEPDNPYALSKVLCDHVAEFYGRSRGLGVARTRAFNHAGPGQADAYVVSAFARQIAAAEMEGAQSVTVRTGNLEARRDFTDVRDVVRAYWLLLEQRAAGAYNVCSGRSVPVADILAGLARQASVAVEQATDERLLRRQDVMDIRGSNKRLVDATGWQPEIALERTLGDALEWWREQLGATR
jgi:GDP-4-dehydro-6-deoxy-D-mannose reductase